MKPYEQWKQLVETERQQAEHDAFWNAYFEKETEAYRQILTENTGKLTGTHAELSDRFQMSVEEFAGFIPRQFAVVCGATLAYLVLMYLAGFYISTALFMVSMMLFSASTSVGADRFSREVSDAACVPAWVIC